MALYSIFKTGIYNYRYIKSSLPQLDQHEQKFIEIIMKVFYMQIASIKQ